MRAAPFMLLALAAGCECGIDTPKLDAIRCESKADCRPEQDCAEEGYCAARECEEPSECGDDAVYDCFDGFCSSRSCEEDDDCEGVATCEDGVCVPGRSCEDDPDCDDGDACNGAETCDAGACASGEPLDCSDLDTPCRQGACDVATGECVAKILDADDDGYGALSCGGDDCDDADDTVSPGDPEGAGGPEDGTCGDTLDNDCDGLTDAADTACIVCAEPADCDDRNPCTADDCDGARCVNEADDAVVPEDDGASCTIDRCVAGRAVHEPDDSACDDEEECTDEYCGPLDGESDPESGCVRTSAAEGEPCDDLDECTANDACAAGVCEGDFLDCDDGLPCTADRCDGAGGCANDVELGCLVSGVCVDDGAPSPDEECLVCDRALDPLGWTEAAGPCDDLDPCTSGDACALGSCAGTPYVCDDARACTTDACDGAGGCDRPVVAGTCLVGGACRAAGEANPLDPCEECDPVQSQIAWVDGDDLCDDLDSCTSGDVCAGGACAGTPYVCDDGLSCTADSCDGAGGCTAVLAGGSCAIDTACWAAGEVDPANQCAECDPARDAFAWSDRAGGCDDVDPCTTADACAAGQCAGTTYSCDDGLTCTSDVCDGAGGCSNPLTGQRCLIAGVCRNNGEVNPANGCEECNPFLNQSAWTVDDTSTPSDGVMCTVDGCLLGAETHVADDASCQVGEVCAPCAGSGNGCAAPPTIDLACTDSAQPGDAGAPCTVALGVAGQAACLGCSSVVGVTSLILDRFDGCPNLAASGWTVVGTPNCPIDAPVAPDPNVAEDALEADDETWSIEQVVDTSDLNQVRLCFDYADNDADANDTLRVFMDVGAGGGFALVFSDGGGPVAGIEDTWYTFCLDLDALDVRAADNPALGIRIQLSSNTGSEDVYLDVVALDAWDDAYVSLGTPAIDEHFTGCDLSAWTIAGGPVGCPVVGLPADGREALEAEDVQWTITRDADASAFCDDVWIGFEYGTHTTTAAESFDLDYDAGAGFVVGWFNERRAAANDAFASITVSLSHLNPDVRFDPALGIRFSADSSAAGRSIVLDDITLVGASCASGDALLTLSPITDALAGQYTFNVQSPVQATTYLTCRWDGRASVSDRDQVVFAP